MSVLWTLTWVTVHSTEDELKQDKAPVHANRGWLSECVSCLLWTEILVIAQVVDVLEHRSSWRQVLRLQEQLIELIGNE